MFAGRGQQLWPDEMPLGRKTRLARASGLEVEHCAMWSSTWWVIETKKKKIRSGGLVASMEVPLERGK